MLKWFRRKKDNKALANQAEQELSTQHKLAMIEEAHRKLDQMKTERRIRLIPVELDRRKPLLS